MQHLLDAMYREMLEALRYGISHDVSNAEAIKQIGRTTMWTDGSYMDAPVVSGPTVWAGASDGPGSVEAQFRNSVFMNVRCQRTLIINEVDLIAFIGKVINMTRLEESRIARYREMLETQRHGISHDVYW